jgi:AraC family transcriptional regulator, regulatory protein of adaptative response / DNA-3-methyladenine glycosylase II
MYERVLAGDPAWNGRFFTGVLTTGIYCLPSCKARKPKLENVRFFATCEAAREAGLRACKKCHPDDFAKGADPVLETIEALVAEIRDNPGAFSDVRAVVKRSGFGATRAFELFRLHYHSTPADLLMRARLDLVKRELPSTTKPLIEIAQEAGFESLSVLHENFRAMTGMTPGAYRELVNATGFDVNLPRGYLMPYLRRALSRDKDSATERLEGDRYTAGVQLSTGASILRMQFTDQSVNVTFSAGNAFEVHELVVGLLGLDQNATAFARLARSLGLSRLVAHREELRISRTASVLDGLLWSIIGQQINFAFAGTLRRRLIQHAGTRVADGLYAPPTASAIAALSPAELLPLQFSRQKAGYVIATARLIVEGKLDLGSLKQASATRAERTLLSVRGLGPWSVNYVMMRALGFLDCVPLGDTGVTSGLQSLLKLEQRPDVDATRRLMAMFSPYRSLATAHLWQLNQPAPT